MPLYDYKCLKCGKEFEEVSTVEKRNDVKCECGGKTEKLVGSMGQAFDPFQPYWTENMATDPVLITSREHRRQLLKEKKLDIMPYKRNEYEGYRPVVNGHKVSEHEYQKMQKVNFFKPRYKGPDLGYDMRPIR